ncbi:MAG: hypothetical protein GF330_00065 [Candidatus Eisenbacteria bacterium]|nr:hypothetical protein [Candidatus Eisenbacteria bacterium]
MRCPACVRRRGAPPRDPHQARLALHGFLLLAILAIPAMLGTSARAGAPLRFAPDAPLVRAIDDTSAIAEPDRSDWNMNRWLVDAHGRTPLDDLLALHTPRPAQDINALDRVPACSWFRPRNGQRRLSTQEIARGNAPRALIARGPLDVLAGRCDGREPFLLIRDAGGDRWILEFDRPDHPLLATGAAIVAARLLHAAGYHVLPARILTIDPADLTLSDAARAIGLRGGEGTLEQDALDRLLLRLADEGRVRVAASRLPAGERKGGFRDRGTRSDDPNDRIPHEDRRALRGLLPLIAWLDHPGLRPSRTLDLYLSSGRYLRHYLVGLSATLGCLEHMRAEPGAASAESFAFDAAHWLPPDPFRPFTQMGHADLYWGLSLLLSFDEAQIRAAVSAAEFPPELEARVAHQLLMRWQTIGRAYLERINGAGSFRVREEGAGRWRLLCDDLGVAAGLRNGEQQRFLLRYAYENGEDSGAQQVRGVSSASFDLTPFAPLPSVPQDDPRRYGVATVTALGPQGERRGAATRVHVYYPPGDPPRVVGIVRD